MAYSETKGEICGGPSAVYIANVKIPLERFAKQEEEVSALAYFHPESIKMAIDGKKPLRYNKERVEFAEDFIPVFDLFWRKIYQNKSLL